MRTIEQPRSRTAVQTKPEPERPFFAPALHAGQIAADHVVSSQGSTANPFFFSGGVKPRIQAKLTINQAGDQYEQDADRVAQQVMGMSDTQLRGSSSCGTPTLVGGECKGCQKKREDQNQGGKPNPFSANKLPLAGYIGEVEDTPALTPQQVDGGIPATAPPPSGGGCTDICNRAYANSSLNRGGGGVICDGATKCACVFDVAPLRRGDCPDLDADVLNHETHHLTDVDCDSTQGLHRPPFRNPADATSSECTHRRASIAALTAAIPSQSATCRTPMTNIRDRLRTWVAANCGA